MGSNRPLTKEEWAEYWETVEEQEKREYLRLRTYTVLFKILCPACSHNAETRKKIVYDCPNCRIIKWHNCSIRQVQSGEIKNIEKKIEKRLDLIENMLYNKSNV